MTEPTYQYHVENDKTGQEVGSAMFETETEEAAIATALGTDAAIEGSGMTVTLTEDGDAVPEKEYD